MSRTVLPFLSALLPAALLGGPAIAPSRAWAGPETLSAASGARFEAAAALGSPARARLRMAAAGVRPALRRNPIGTVKGAVNHAPAELVFNRRAWTITGGINASPVQVSIDHAQARITGGANHSPVDLRFQWSPESVVVEGGANRSPVRLAVDWGVGTVSGHASHAPVELRFDLEAGTVSGYANRAPVELRLDKASGNLTGHLNRSPVQLTLVNLDLSDFLQYLFLFLKP